MFAGRRPRADDNGIDYSWMFLLILFGRGDKEVGANATKNESKVEIINEGPEANKEV